MIKGIINGQSLTVSAPLIVSDTVDYLTAEFTFSEDWLGLDKWAHFAHKSAENGEERECVYDVKLTDDKILKSDHLNLSAGIWSVYLHGTRSAGGEPIERITTDGVTIAVMDCGEIDGEPLPLTPMSVAERILAMIGDLSLLETEARSDLVSAINEAAAKDGGAGNGGADGEDGVGIESVEQTTTSNASGGKNVITITLTDGTTSTFTVYNGAVGARGEQGLPGENGNDGEDGKDGYTPVKGTDYWTDADKEEMVSDVLAALPTWTGGSY